ncbi:MAG: CRISPR-associated protein Csx18 [Cyanobacteria bacterium]|nr:CRISPR-associated protein Csx18 [Cyanobacteriota bacterium]
MYLSPRALQVRNGSIAGINGTLTLVILLIAPLGLAAVIINTVLVTIATYITGTVVDRVTLSIQRDRIPPDSGLDRRNSRDLDRF